jgi:hypothetical protein
MDAPPSAIGTNVSLLAHHTMLSGLAQLLFQEALLAGGGGGVREVNPLPNNICGVAQAFCPLP